MDKVKVRLWEPNQGNEDDWHLNYDPTYLDTGDPFQLLDLLNNPVKEGLYEAIEQPERLQLMFAVGCTDIFNKEIYPMDIVRVENPLGGYGIISNIQGCYGINSTFEREFIPLCELTNVEVIGNVFENPELIKKCL